MGEFREFIRSLPVVGPLARGIGRLVSPSRSRQFPGTTNYWESRYATGGNSGSGSRGRLAEFKAGFLNEFVREQRVQSVIEFGCGDSMQLAMYSFPEYIGLDISALAVRKCQEHFGSDKTKRFSLYDPAVFVAGADPFRAELGLSIDVIFHIVEDEMFVRYMSHLFASSTRFVIVYSSDFEAPQKAHERRRCFSEWVERNEPDWRLLRTVRNPYPYDENDPENTSLSDYYVYGR